MGATIIKPTSSEEDVESRLALKPLAHTGELGDVAHYAVAAYGLTLSEGSTAGVIGGGASLDNIPDTHWRDMAVGHLNAHEGDLTGGRATRTLLAPRVRAILSCRLATSESFNPWSRVNS